MKKSTLTLFMILPLTLSITGCKSFVPVHELQPYLFETDVYTTLDYEFANKYYRDNNDNWGGGCTAITKQLSNGHRVIGRNMDLNISNKCAYIVKTQAGKYRTLGLAYTFRDYSPDYNLVKQNGIDSDFAKLLPFMCDDVINDQGLHIEINMRHAECWPNGEDKFSCQHTNELSSHRVHMFELPRLVAENCETVGEAVDYLSDLDIYSKNKYWNYCFLISDAHKGSILVEFCLNQMFVFAEYEIPFYNQFIHKVEQYDYTINALGQANFYVNYIPYVMQDTKTGLGRYQTLQNGILDVDSRDEMFNLMDKISYSWFYEDYDLCKNEHFDPRSEQIGEFKGATFNFMMNDLYEAYIKNAMNAYSKPIREIKDRQVKRDKNEYWESTFTEVVDCNDKTIMVRFFEDYDMMYNITFNGITKIPNNRGNK